LSDSLAREWGAAGATLGYADLSPCLRAVGPDLGAAPAGLEAMVEHTYPMP
jgi:hypothetical protein